MTADEGFEKIRGFFIGVFGVIWLTRDFLPEPSRDYLHSDLTVKAGLLVVAIAVSVMVAIVGSILAWAMPRGKMIWFAIVNVSVVVGLISGLITIFDALNPLVDV